MLVVRLVGLLMEHFDIPSLSCRQIRRDCRIDSLGMVIAKACTAYFAQAGNTDPAEGAKNSWINLAYLGEKVASRCSPIG